MPMKSHYLYTGNDRLILLFVGWAMDWHPFSNLHRAGYDIAVIWDYTESDFPPLNINHYREIVVVGWSMGVLAAERFVKQFPQLPVTATIAVAGTPTPRHDMTGIPTAIYDATMQINSRQGLDKFYRRVAGGGGAMSSLFPEIPRRDPVEAQNELLAITERTDRRSDFDAELFDQIIIGRRDKIFPYENLLRAWQCVADRVTIDEDMAHLPDFNRLLLSRTINKDNVKTRFTAAATTYDQAASVQSEVAEKLARSVPVAEGIEVLEIGAGSGLLTRELQQKISGSHITTLDLTPASIPAVNGNVITTIEGDAELSIRDIPDHSFDMIVSASTIQWFNSPRRFLQQVARVLRPGGKAFISTFGPSTLDAIRRVAPQGMLPYPSVSLPNGVKGTISSVLMSLDFDNGRDALRHLKLTGVNGSSDHPLPVSLTRRILDAVTDPVNGRAALSFEVVEIEFTKPENLS